MGGGRGGKGRHISSDVMNLVQAVAHVMTNTYKDPQGPVLCDESITVLYTVLTSNFFNFLETSSVRKGRVES